MIRSNAGHSAGLNSEQHPSVATQHPSFEDSHAPDPSPIPGPVRRERHCRLRGLAAAGRTPP